MKLIGNLIWFIFGGFLVALEYLVSSLLMMVTIIGIPFGLQTLKLAMVSLWPFGVNIKETESAGGCLSILLNLIWILIGGIWIALTHLLFGIFFCITIIGIPFGKQHFKMAALALTPFGKTFEWE